MKVYNQIYCIYCGEVLTQNMKMANHVSGECSATEEIKYINPTGSNENFKLDDIKGLTEEQKAQILEWFGRKVWTIIEESTCEPEYHCKRYDPLVIEGNTAHSYVFDFEDGGRHHPIKSLLHLENLLVAEAINKINHFE